MSARTLCVRGQVLGVLLAFGCFGARAQQAAVAAAGGQADTAIQGYYLGGENQPLTSVTGIATGFQHYMPGIALIRGHLEGYSEGHGAAIGENYVEVSGLHLRGRLWSFTGGDYRFSTRLTKTPATNYYFPDIFLRGARAEMVDGRRQYEVFWGTQTLSQGPRITFRTSSPEQISGVQVHEQYGEHLELGARLIHLQAGSESVNRNLNLFPLGREYSSSDAFTVSSTWKPRSKLTVFSEGSLTRATFAQGFENTPGGHPVSYVTGVDWRPGRLSLKANYGDLAPALLSIPANFFGDRKGPWVEARYRLFKTAEIYASGQQTRTNLTDIRGLPTVKAASASGGFNVPLLFKVSLGADFSFIKAEIKDTENAAANHVQRDSQGSVSLSRSFSGHSLQVTARQLNLRSTLFRQIQRSVEANDSVHFSRFTGGGGVRLQQLHTERLSNSVFVRGNLQAHIRKLNAYAQFEVGNDLANKNLFATNSLSTSLYGVTLTTLRGWTIQAEAFRTTLIQALNPENVLALQTIGSGLTTQLAGLNTWNFYLRASRRNRWGAGLPEEMGEYSIAQALAFGSVEGLVKITGQTKPGKVTVGIRLDGARVVTADAAGHYRFEQVEPGEHTVEIDLEQLPTDYSPAGKTEKITVAARRGTRFDLEIIPTGGSIHGEITGLQAEDETNHLNTVVINLRPRNRFTVADTAGGFAFYNLPDGHYTVSVDPKSLPEFYFVAGPQEMELDVRADSPTPAVKFVMEKRETQLPTRKVLQKTAKGPTASRAPAAVLPAAEKKSSPEAARKVRPDTASPGSRTQPHVTTSAAIRPPGSGPGARRSAPPRKVVKPTTRPQLVAKRGTAAGKVALANSLKKTAGSLKTTTGSLKKTAGKAPIASKRGAKPAGASKRPVARKRGATSPVASSSPVVSNAAKRRTGSHPSAPAL